MLIGLLSDTHGNIAFVNIACMFLVNELKVDKVYHLGDNYSDIDSIDIKIPTVRVPGIYDQEYNDPQIAQKISEQICQYKVVIVHDIKTLPENDIADANIIFYGHTHIPRAEMLNGKIFINPGHLKNVYYKNQEATFATVKVNTNIEVHFYNINKQLVDKKIFTPTWLK